jgi:membrane-associated phospholipid phosphatase
VLVGLFPTQQTVFDQALAESLAQVPEGPSQDNGVAVGIYVAESILAWRAGDHSDEVHPYTAEILPGVWRPTPPGFADAVGVNWPYVTPFALLSADQIEPPLPPAMSSRQYAEAVFEVALLGEINTRYRTRDQTAVAFFWADDFNSVSPPGRWSVIAQIVTKKKHYSISQNARLFALLNVALADSCIAAWHCKYTYNIWRPIDAIREADTDGNYFTMPIPGWTPLLKTPAFPDYVSGHSTFGGAGAKIIALFCGTDNMQFTLESTHPGAGPRKFKTLSQACLENGRSRIYAGIHYRFADYCGQALGRQIANYVWANYMRPL